MQQSVDGQYSKAAEAAVLGSMIIDPPCISRVISAMPSDEAFYLPEHRILYNAIIKLYIDNQKVDAVLLRDELEKHRQLESVGGVEYIAKVMDSVPSSANAMYYAGIVKEKQQQRKLLTIVEEVNRISGEPLDLSEKTQQIQELVFNLEGTRTNGEFIEAKKKASQVAVDMRGHQDGLIKTGFSNIDRIIGGVAPGEVCILAGRPSMGKSALMLDIALNMAKAGMGVLIFTLEMTEASLIERGLCNLAKVNLAQAKADQITQAEWELVYKEALGLDNVNLILSKTASTPEQQLGLICRLKQSHNIGMVFIDYLQLMNCGRRTENRQQEITEISRKLKHIAIKEEIPIIALSQLNRQVESREKHRPRMSDLRDSGSLEQDADVVMFVHREDYYRRNEDPQAEGDGIAEIIISKNRRGPVGIVELTFFEEYVKFGDLTREHYEETALCQNQND